MTKTFIKPASTGQSGFTLLELLLVIGVAALLLIGGIATYRLVSDGNKGTETTRLLLTIRQESAAMAQQQNGVYTGIAFASGTSAPASPIVTAGILRNNQRNAFNGAITIAPVNGTGTDDNLRVSFANISQSQCAKLAQSINNPTEVVSVTVGTTALTVPVTVAAASTACATAANTVIWQFP